MGEVKDSKEYGKFIMDFIYHEDRIFTSRVNLFLIAESLLILSYVTILCNNLREFSYLLGLTGIIITSFYFKVLSGNYKILEKLKKVALDEEKDYCPHYRKMKRDIYFRHRSNLILGISIPGVFLTLWIILFIFSFIFS